MARRTREQWLGLFQAQLDGGLSATEFCRRRGINPNYFFQRKAKLDGHRAAPSGQATGFVELQPPTPVASAAELHFGQVSLSLPTNTLHMIRRRARKAGLSDELCCHSSRGTGITLYLENDGDLDTAAWIAGHASTRTTKL